MYKGIKIFTARRSFYEGSKAIDFVLKPPEKIEEFSIDYGMTIKIREGKNKNFFYLNAEEVNRLKNVLKQFTEQSEQTTAIIRKCRTCKWIEKHKKKDLFFD